MIQDITVKCNSRIELPNILNNPTVVRIAKKHNKSNAQVLLRHLVQKGICTIPKSTNPVRLRENLDIFNFKLDEQDLVDLNGLDTGVRLLDFLIFNG